MKSEKSEGAARKCSFERQSISQWCWTGALSSMDRMWSANSLPWCNVWSLFWDEYTAERSPRGKTSKCIEKKKKEQRRIKIRNAAERFKLKKRKIFYHIYEDRGYDKSIFISSFISCFQNSGSLKTLSSQFYSYHFI